MKRLAELDERVLESEIWKDATIYCLLSKNNQGNFYNYTLKSYSCFKNTAGPCIISEVAQFYEFVVAPVDQNQETMKPMETKILQVSYIFFKKKSKKNSLTLCLAGFKKSK